MKSFAELSGDFSDAGAEFEERDREGMGIRGLPGIGMSEEVYRSIEHRVCMSCGDLDVRYREEAFDQLPSATAGYGTLNAVVAFHFAAGAEGELEAVVVSATGDANLLPYLPAAYLDKILANARGIDDAAEGLIDRAVSFFSHALANWPDQPAEALADAVPLKDEWETAPDATVRVEVAGSLIARSRLGATTHFHPLKAQNETVGELALWALWDWVVLTSWKEEAFGTVIATMVNLSEYYAAHGAPRLRDLGKAPFAVTFGE